MAIAPSGSFLTAPRIWSCATSLRPNSQDPAPWGYQGLVVISAHWFSRSEPQINVEPSPALMYDFYGFPSLSTGSAGPPGAPSGCRRR